MQWCQGRQIDGVVHGWVRCINAGIFLRISSGVIESGECLFDVIWHY